MNRQSATGSMNNTPNAQSPQHPMPPVLGWAEMSHDLVGVCREGRLESLNSPGRFLLAGPGGDPDAVVGRPFLEFLTPAYQDALAPLDRLLDEPGGLPVRVRRLDGSVGALTLRAQALDDGSLLLQGRDIEGQVRGMASLVAARKRLARVIDQSMGLVCLVAAGRLTFINRAGAALLGAPEAAALIGQPMASLVAPDYRPLFEEAMAVLAAEPAPVPMRLLSHQGRLIDAEVRVSPFRQEGADGYMIEARDISARLRAAESARERERRLSAILAHVGEGILTVSRGGRIETFNPAAERLFLLGAVQVIGEPPDLVLPGFQALLKGETRDRFATETLGRRGDGSEVPLALTLSVLPRGEPWLVISARDISARRRLELEEEHSRTRLHLADSLLDATREGVAVCDEWRRVVMVNPAFCALVGRPAADMVGKPGERILVCTPDQQPVIAQAFHDAAPWSGEVWHTRPDGSRLAVRLGLTPLTTSTGQPGLALTVSDITQSKQDEERLLHKTTHDGLTGLVNRALFRDRLDHAVALAMRAGRVLALVIVDLDDFKAINEARGHGGGDEVLVEIARRLQGCARDSDTVARLGSDEFALILNDLGGLEDAGHVATRVLDTLRQAMTLGDGTVSLTASLGIAVLPPHALEAAPLLARAEAALADAKTQGKNGWRFPKGEHTEDHLYALDDPLDNPFINDVFAEGDDSLGTSRS